MKADFDLKNGLLGDSCLPEPALNAYGLRNGGSVNVYIPNPLVRPLYANHPVIRLADEPSGNVMDESKAFWHAVQRDRYFATGFWPQVGLGSEPADGERTHFRFHAFDKSVRPYDCITLCAFSRSCDVWKGGRANKTVPVEWWEDIIHRVGDHRTVDGSERLLWFSLGSHEDPPIKGTINIRDLSLSAAARFILASRLLVTVETWANIVAADKQANGLGRTLFMSAAVPLSFIQPPGSEVVRHPHPDQWDKGETVEKIKRLLLEI